MTALRADLRAFPTVPGAAVSGAPVQSVRRTDRGRIPARTPGAGTGQGIRRCALTRTLWPRAIAMVALAVCVRLLWPSIVGDRR